MLPGIIGTLQATEAIKVLTGIGEPMIGKFLHYDALTTRFKTFNTTPDPECEICGKNATIKTVSRIEGYDEEANFPEITVDDLAHLIKTNKKINILDVRNPDEVEEFHIKGSQFIPLPQIEKRISEIDPSVPIHVICKSGIRSLKACIELKANGITQLTNVQGGTDAWINRFNGS